MKQREATPIEEPAGPATRRVCFGIFVGGTGQRMGGVAKGLLRAARGTTLVERSLAACHRAEPDASVVLVGRRQAYAETPLVQLEDDPPGIGPLGGLRALLHHASELDGTGGNDSRRVVALACDLPQIDAQLLRRLVCESPEADVLAPKLDGLWQPLCARYTPSLVLTVLEQRLNHGRYSLLGLFEELGPNCVELALSSDEARAVQDCDTPEDAAKFGLRPDADLE